jgi:replicative DNA helicase
LDNWGSRKKGTLTGVPTGFYDLDDLLSGLQKSDLIICAGRPSMGKTALALSIARNAALEYGHKVGIFSLEMSNTQLVERLITAEAQVDSHLVRTGRLPKNEWKKLSQAAGPLSDANIFIDDTAGLNIMDLRAKARQLKAEHDVELIIVDYIQLLNSGGNIESRQQEISFISRSLKALAKDLNVPVLALSQLSRAVENRTDHRPIMSDLRESGAIEQDADVILFIYRKFMYSRDEEDKGLGEILVAKHRNGPTGSIDISFISRYAKFENLSKLQTDYIPDDIPV